MASKFVKIHVSKLLLLSLRADSRTIFVVANFLGLSVTLQSDLWLNKLITVSCNKSNELVMLVGSG